MSSISALDFWQKTQNRPQLSSRNVPNLFLSFLNGEGDLDRYTYHRMQNIVFCQNYDHLPATGECPCVNVCCSLLL